MIKCLTVWSKTSKPLKDYGNGVESVVVKKSMVLMPGVDEVDVIRGKSSSTRSAFS
jgi:hypothetical protein